MFHFFDSYSKMNSRTNKVWIDNMDGELFRFQSENEKKNDEITVTKIREAKRNYCRRMFVFQLEMTFDIKATVRNKIEGIGKKGICSPSAGEREGEEG